VRTSTSVVYLIASHTNASQVERLVRRLRAAAPLGQVVIHHDPTGEPLDRHGLSALPRVQFIPDARPVRWGDVSHMDMVLSSFDWLVRTLDFDWVVMLSGQDYPVRPLGELERFLASTSFDGFIEGVPVEAPSRGARILARGVDEFTSRYFYRYVGLHLPRGTRRILARAWPTRLVRVLPSGEVRLGLPCLRLPFTRELRCHHGSDWYTLSRRCVEILSRVPTERRRLWRHYARTFMPVESIPHTVLHSQPGLRLSDDNMRYLSWPTKPSPHPDVLRLGDLERITASGAFFARKFDERTDSAVLDVLDARLAGFPASR
jgi:Core-2/I-Branching enzyme